MPRLPPVDMSPQARLCARFSSGDTYSARTCFQSAIQFIGDELREPGERTLPHLGTRDAHDCRVIRADHHPDAEFLSAALRERRNMPAECEATADGRDRTEEGTATKCKPVAHGAASLCLAAE